MIISIILPVFNEDQNIDLMCQKLTEVLTENQEKFEIIFVNDGSGDSSLAILKEIARQDSRIKFISFTRNFGHQAAIIAGLNYAKGNALITMDCDFQDPPELIPEMLKKWKIGRASCRERV